MALKRLDSFIDKDLLIHAALLDRMSACAQQHLPPYLAKSCWVVGFGKDLLHLITNQAALAGPIYFQQREILKRMNEEFGDELQVCFRKTRVHVSSR